MSATERERLLAKSDSFSRIGIGWLFAVILTLIGLPWMFFASCCATAFGLSYWYFHKAMKA